MQPFDFLGSETPAKLQQQQPSQPRRHLPDTPHPTSYAAFPDDEEQQQFRSVPSGETPVNSSVASSTASTQQRHKNLVQAMYIGLFAMLGTFLRMIVAQVFGEYCNNPDSIGWLKASAPLCVTNGVATEEGGVIFADLPANMLGCFVMGLFQNGAALGLALPFVAVAWLRPYDPLQEMNILHKAITTGFCGSLTTFSGWNSAMVVLLFGTGQNRPTHVFNAIFGYIIGMETAIGSFVAGKSVARRLHKVVNPVLAAEAAAMKQRAEEGVYMNPKLPDFERRFLPNLQMGGRGEKNYGELLPVGHIDALERWRESTKAARRIRHAKLEALKYIENAVLVEGMPVPPDAVSLAKANGWDLPALEAWVTSTRNRGDRLPSLSSTSMIDLSSPNPTWFQLHYVATVFTLVCAVLIVLLILLNGQHSYTITNRTMVYALLWAPAGAILRWKLSSLNGTMTAAGWEWFPLGTFTANFIGSIISMVAIGGEYNMDSIYDVTNFWGVGTIRAVKVGFAGSLTTVSTFVAEINGFMRKSDHAYPYMLTTICSCCAVASLCYGVLLLVREDVGDVYH